jgi:hypothetical protein
MSQPNWPTFSFTECLSPPDGWRTDCAILSTYSADLIVIVTSLLALGGCDLESRKKGSRVELVKAIEALRGRVCVLAQAGRVAVPSTPVPILKLLDKFLTTVVTDESVSSFHPKTALLRFHNLQDPEDRQWRIWIGSRNLTRASNWETGLVLVSRVDGKGQRIEGLAAVAQELASRAKLADFPPRALGQELAKLTWECPAGCDVSRVSILGPGFAKGLPKPPSDTERVFVISPFLDEKTVRTAAQWGGAKTSRTLVSTAMEFQRLFHENDQVYTGFDHLCTQPLPDLPGEGAALLGEDNAAAELADGEEAPPAGLHAKLLYAAKGARRQLWLGSANATNRGWNGRNLEIVAELNVGKDAGQGIDSFVDTCEIFTPVTIFQQVDEDELALETARMRLSGCWPLRQLLREDVLEIRASAPPPITDPAITIEIAAMGGAWNTWPLDADHVLLTALRNWDRTDFVQLRVIRGDKVCSWLQVAPCDPPPDEKRDHGLIAQYLDPHTFLWWLRSLLNDSPVEGAGGDWDADPGKLPNISSGNSHSTELGSMPTIEEILRAWARDSAAFLSADRKVKAYLGELERRAAENETAADTQLLKTFRKTWDTLAKELR